MQIDLLAGRATVPATLPLVRPTILILDSGLGGLTVMAEVRRARPDADYVYAADDAAFPYGAWSEAPLVARVAHVVERLIERHEPDLVVVACNTISTLVLPVLRARFALPFVGTVPAIKPAAALSRSGRIAVLATPGTVRRDYTRGLVAAYAGAVAVDLVGSDHLAAHAERELAGDPASDDAVRAEIAPCFVADDAGRRTDVVALACTHFPLLVERFRELAPWPVTWLDPAPAIARRVADLIGPVAGPAAPDTHHLAVFTRGQGLSPALRAGLAARGLGRVATEAVPLEDEVVRGAGG